ncbi:hypothetical protein [Microseira wollei]|nr:hypothetical protein [Microseira wollei]
MFHHVSAGDIVKVHLVKHRKKVKPPDLHDAGQDPDPERMRSSD